jgi:MoaE-MoaD fusion protein
VVVRVLYFAAARERAGVPLDELEGGGTVADVLARVVALRPGLGAIVGQCRVAVDQAFAKPGDVVPDGAEVAIIPPVAGGAAKARVRDAPLSVDEAIAAVKRPDAGAIVVMLGTVRDHVSEGGVAVDGVARLEYEAYVEMAERVIDGIVVETEQAIAATRGFVLHRTGRLDVGDVAVVVAASAPHRGEAFDACRRISDRLKQDAPIW